MDGKTVAIAALVVVAMLLGGIVASELRPGREAYGQGGVYATYLTCAAAAQGDVANFAVVDTASRRLIFYEVDQSKNKLKLAGGFKLEEDFHRKSSTP
jgi:hypothetical protein